MVEAIGKACRALFSNVCTQTLCATCSDDNPNDADDNLNNILYSEQDTGNLDTGSDK